MVNIKVETRKNTNDDWEDLTNIFFPIEFTPKLNEDLDGAIIIRLNSINEPYSFGEQIRFIFDDDIEKKQEYIIAFDSMQQKSFVEPYLFEHTVNLIEATKILEGTTVDSRSFLKSIDPNATNLTIAEVITILLKESPLRASSINPQLFTLISNERLNIEAPEFTFNAPTLWEALSELGSYVQAIPRVVDYNKIDFTFLDEFEAVAQQDKFNFNIQTRSEDQYCTELDSNVENILSENNQASITFPYGNGWITPRSESEEVLITPDTMVIELLHPIYQIKKVLVTNFTLRYADNHTEPIHLPKTLDITESVIEQNNWELKEDRFIHPEDNYEDSKGNFLTYKRYDNYIRHLSYKTSIQGLNRNIINVLAVNLPIRSELATETDFDFLKVLYQIQYIPVSDMRAKTARANIKGFETPFTLYNNQNEKSVSNLTLGENQKGLIDRMGSIIAEKVIYVKNFDDIPKIGTVEDDKYIVEVTTVIQQEYYKCTITYSQDFNRLQEFIRNDRTRRSWQIPSEPVTTRKLNYSEYIEVGLERNTSQTSLITESGIRVFHDVFSQTNNLNRSGVASNCLIAGSSFQKTVSAYVNCNSLNFGNSLIFNCSTKDNFSAGANSEFDTSSRRIKQDVEYSDGGETFILGITILSTIDSEATNQQKIDFADDYPAKTLSDIPADRLFRYSGGNVFVLTKNVGESISMNIQQHIVSVDDKVIIGSFLSRNNPLITEVDSAKACKIIGLQRKVNRYEKIISQEDINNGYQIRSSVLSFVIDNSYISIIGIILQQPIKSWIITNNDRELILAVNEEKASGEVTSGVYINFMNTRTIA